MKAVLIAIHPRWCELIASGKKTIEVRKTKPKLDVPFKCYIYCTMPKNKHDNLVLTPFGYDVGSEAAYCNYTGNSNGKVIGEFVCDDIDTVHIFNERLYCVKNSQANKLGQMCLSIEEVKAYLGDKNGYNWHISDLIVYDEPRELSEFYVWKKCNSCRDTGYESTACCYDEDCRVPAVITRPPQSWMFIESEDTE